MAGVPCLSEDSEPQLLKRQEAEFEPSPEEIQEEVRKYAKLLPNVPDPNLGRVQEIREEIQKGTYLSREFIEEAASRLLLRFLRKE